MTDWTYREARDRRLQVLLATPAVEPTFGVVDWPYVAAMRVAAEYREWAWQESVRQLQEVVANIATTITAAVTEFTTALMEAMRPIVEAMSQFVETFRGLDVSEDSAPEPPPWRSSARPLAPRSLGPRVRMVSTRRPVHLPRSCC